jgi:hypothetical protein
MILLDALPSTKPTLVTAQPLNPKVLARLYWATRLIPSLPGTAALDTF